MRSVSVRLALALALAAGQEDEVDQQEKVRGGRARRGRCGARGCGRARGETAGEFGEQEDQYVRGKDTGDAARAKRQRKDDEDDEVDEGDGEGITWNWRRRSPREIIE